MERLLLNLLLTYLLTYLLTNVHMHMPGFLLYRYHLSAQVYRTSNTTHVLFIERLIHSMSCIMPGFAPFQ